MLRELVPADFSRCSEIDRSETMEHKLYEAPLTGSVDSLNELLDEDPSILDRVDTAIDTPLHVATSLGHLSFCDEILRRRPEFAQVVLKGSLPLHLACRRGAVEMVEKLLKVNPEGFLVRDGQGLAPVVQIAAAKGRAQVLCELVKARPNSGVRILTDRGETILHLCVKHNRLEALNQLLDSCGDFVTEIINSKDEDDNTILHLAVAQKNVEAVKLLVGGKEVDMNISNLDGLTAMDLLQYEPTGIDKRMENILTRAGAERSSSANKRHLALQSRQSKLEKHEDWPMEKKGTLMIVAILIATVTYQAGLSPPGGVLQMDADRHSIFLPSRDKAAPSPIPLRFTWHKPMAVMAVTEEATYMIFTTLNTLGFVSSLSIILMLVSGFPLERKLFVRVLMVITWLAIISMAFSYSIALTYLSSYNFSAILSQYWWLLMAWFLFSGHFIPFVVRLTRWLLRKVRNILGLRNELKMTTTIARPTGAADSLSSTVV